MNNAMMYQGYVARVEFDSRDGIFVGRVLGVTDSITFHGETVGELTEDFHHAINHYLADCKETGRQPEKPATGRLVLQVPPEVHAIAKVAAQAAGKTLDQWVGEVLAHAVMA